MLFFCVSTVAAARITSPSYQIDGNLGGSFGGETNSSSYRMTAIGGEAVVGNGSSGSYLLDQQDIGSEVKTMELGVQPSSLVAYYPMDENTGTTTADSSRYQNTGTLKTTAAWSASGKIGSAIDINGSTVTSDNGSVNIADHSGLPSGSQMTFEAWVYSRDTSPVRTVASHWSTGISESWRILQNGGSAYVVIASAQSSGTNNYFITSGSAFTANTWLHLVVVYDGSQAQTDKVKVYLNGVRKSGSTGGTFPSTLQDSTASLSLGGLNGVSSAFPGLIDQVKLFNRALSAAEVKAEYDAQDAGASSGFGLEPTPAASTATAIDAIVRTNSPNYTIGVQQDHDLQSGATTIPAIGGSIASPATWSEGATRGFGFTLTAAPVLDAKWGSGSKYAALPTSVSTFYSGTGNVNKTAEAVSLQLRLHPADAQTPGTYTNSVTYTGTMTP